MFKLKAITETPPPCYCYLYYTFIFQLKYGVTHPDGSITEEMYTLVASRVQRIVSYTTDFLHIMTSYILFDRNRVIFTYLYHFFKSKENVTVSFKITMKMSNLEKNYA